MHMQEKIINWIKLENEYIENQVLGIDGDFGTGKTTYIKNIDKITNWKKIEINKNFVYINLNNNFIDKLIKFFTNSEDVNSKTQKEEEDFIKKITNCLEEKSLLKINDFDNVKIVEKGILNFVENKKEFFNNCVLVLDDIERNNPENIVKALGLIDQLSSKYKKMKILVPHNWKALNFILNNFFGIQNIENKENYLWKYLGNSINFEVDYHELVNFIDTKLIKKKNFWNREHKFPEKFASFLEKLNISWRDVIILKNLYVSQTKDSLIKINFEHFVLSDGFVLFNKEIFKNNVINLENNNYLILGKNKNYFDSFNNHKDEIKNKLLEKAQDDKKIPVGIETTNDIVTIWDIDKDIFEFFKKYHNL